MSLYGITRDPGQAVAVCSAPLALDPAEVLPPPEMMGQRVMIAALGRIIGCARFTGIVSLSALETCDPQLQHRSAAAIRRSLTGNLERFGHRPWVFEDGVTFELSIKVDAGKTAGTWRVPEHLHDELEEARRWAERTGPYP